MKYPIIIAILLLVYTSGATTHIAASTSQSDVQTAVNQCVNGDTVIVPSGSATWSTRVDIADVSITLIGGGGTNGVTTITDNTSGGAINGGTSQTGFIRISGFTFIASGSHTSSGMVDLDCDNDNGVFTNMLFRIDHCTFTIGSAITRGIVTTAVYGLIDHNFFNITATSGSIQSISVFGSSDGTDGGFTPWRRPLSLGTTNAVYMEDNAFSYTTSDANTEDAIDSYGGARIVIRHNTFTNQSIGFHGTDSGSRRSIVSFEIYSNSFINNSSTELRAVTIRGGTGVVFGNTYGGSFGSYFDVTLLFYRALPCMNTGGNWSTWGGCNGTQWQLESANLSANGSRICSITGGFGFNTNDNETLGAFGGAFVRYFDGNGPGGYPGRDQPGIGPGQVTVPIFVWANNGVNASAYDEGCPPPLGLNNYLLAGRDYSNSVSGPAGYTALIYPHPLINQSPGVVDNNLHVYPVTITGGTIISTP